MDFLVKPIDTFSHWGALKDHLRDEAGWVFRGHRLHSWKLETTLERAESEPRRRREVERDLLFQYTQAIKNYIPAGQVPQYRLDWLGSMQHHGAPTRLLDFTRSPYVAAYFAVEDAGPDEPCCLWAIDEGWCHAQAEAALADQTGGSVDLLRWLYVLDDHLDFKIVAPAGPMEKTPRQIAQQSLFMVSGDPAFSFEDNLRAVASNERDLRTGVRCYMLPARWRGEMLADLRLMNITRATLFPGLDGFAQSLRYSLVRERRELASLRKALRNIRDGVAAEPGQAVEPQDDSNGP